MKCQIRFSGKNKKNITNLLSAELAKRVVMVKKAYIFSTHLNYFSKVILLSTHNTFFI